MSEYKGFRIWPLEFQAMTTDQSGVENNSGRLTNTNNNAVYWTEDDNGLKAHLEDFLNPMTDESINGVGWSLDTELYERLAALDGSDPAWQPFKDRNPNLWTPSNTTGDKTIKLVPTTYVRVMCFKHTTGYKAMIGLSLYAMDAGNRLTSFFSGYSTMVDPGFIPRHLYDKKDDTYTASTIPIPCTGGLFISMIPPKESGNPDDWNLEYSIRDENFYSSTMTPIVPMMLSYCYQSTSSNSYQSYFNGCSWLKTGTSTMVSSTDSGVIVGTNMKLSLLLDIKGIIGLAYKYTASTNTTSLNPMIFMGPIFKKKIYKDDTLDTKYLGNMLVGICMNADGQNINNCYNAAWKAYRNGYVNYFTNTSNSFNFIGSFKSDGSTYGSYLTYTAYPACDSTINTNYRYAKAGYTTLGLIDEEVFRWTGTDGLVVGQTYNNGQWIFIGNNCTLPAQDGTTSSSYLYPNIRWDGEFNGTKTFA